MKKVTFLFLLFSFIFSGFAIAQDKVKVNAQIRPRFNLDDKDFNSATEANSYTELRTRLGVAYSPSANLTGFIQIQDSRIYGTEPSTMANTQNLDIHQAYFKIENLFELPFYLKVGRMELSYGSQRILGAVGWSNVGRSFDASLLQFQNDAINIDFIAARTNESMLEGDSLDTFVYSAYGNLKVVDSHIIQPFIIAEYQAKQDFNRYTIGIYATNKNKGAGFKHELDASYQLGTQRTDVDISAFMVAYNLGYTFDSKLKPMIGAGVDYLSGDDGADATKYKTFNTLYATNHKFYGYMDYFVNIPKHTYGLGLMDIQVKGSIVPIQKLKVALAYHIFNANADYTLIDGSTSASFGSEIDLTLSYKYSGNVKFVGGFSFFTPGDIFKERKGEDSSNWTYLMAVVNL
ncbi:MAG: alginate export family protein [Melioribacteraceae bacterium]|nr:alginate export family protein [Melioribacteraceae bacterium]